MTHEEYVYLLARAHTMRRFDLEAASRGEEFRASQVYVPIEHGLEAQAWIRPIEPGGPACLVLFLRHPADVDGEAAVQQAIQQFFSGEHYRLGEPALEKHKLVHGFCSNEVPPSVIPV